MKLPKKFLITTKLNCSNPAFEWSSVQNKLQATETVEGSSSKFKSYYGSDTNCSTFAFTQYKEKLSDILK